MKSRDQIQRAHDTLEAIALSEVPTPDPPKTHATPEETRQTCEALASVLCWVLEDANARTFDEFVRAMAEDLRSKGYVLRPATLFPMQKRPGEG